MKVVIPAAGLGSRFSRDGVSTPKELLPLGGSPLILHALAEAARAGFDGAVVVVSPQKPGLRELVSAFRGPLPVEEVIQDEALGIGDAVLRCWRRESLGVLLPDDVVLETQHWHDLFATHSKAGAPVLCVRPVPLEQISRFGIAECDGDRIVRVIEKPPPGATFSNLAIFGRYIVTEEVVNGLLKGSPRRELELTDGFAAALTAPLGVRAVQFHGDIFDCGTPAAYAESIRRFPVKAT